MMIEMNKILKRNTSDEDDPRYNVGGFKVVPNIIGIVNVIKQATLKMWKKILMSCLLNIFKIKESYFRRYN